MSEENNTPPNNTSSNEQEKSQSIIQPASVIFLNSIAYLLWFAQAALITLNIYSVKFIMPNNGARFILGLIVGTFIASLSTSILFAFLWLVKSAYFLAKKQGM